MNNVLEQQQSVYYKTEHTVLGYVNIIVQELFG